MESGPPTKNKIIVDNDFILFQIVRVIGAILSILGLIGITAAQQAVGEIENDAIDTGLTAVVIG